MGKMADGELRAIMMILRMASTIRLCTTFGNLLNDIKYFIKRINMHHLIVVINSV